jgi:hypothetical protein
MSKENEAWKYQVSSIKAISRRYRIHKDRLRNWKEMHEAIIALPLHSLCFSNDDLPLDIVGLNRVLNWDRDPDVLRALVAQELAVTWKRRRVINMN